DLEEALRMRYSLGREPWLPPFLTVGSWVGGDRDGNPNVGAQTLEIAVSQQARMVLAHYLEEVNQLGRELGLSARLMPTPREVIAGALEEQGAGLLAEGRLRALRRKVSVFGFHLAPVDLRQSSDEHAQTVAELLARVGVEAAYGELDEARRTALLARELAGP